MGSSMVSGADWMLLGFEWEGRYWWMRGIGKQLTAGECIVGSSMVSGADWLVLGFEWDWRYWWVRENGRQLTVGD